MCVSVCECVCVCVTYLKPGETVAQLPDLSHMQYGSREDRQLLQKTRAGHKDGQWWRTSKRPSPTWTTTITSQPCLSTGGDTNLTCTKVIFCSLFFLGIVSGITASKWIHCERLNALQFIFQPIGGAWNSPKTEKKRLSMRIKLARCIQTDSRSRNRTQEEEDEND